MNGLGHGGCGGTTPGLTSSPHGYVRTCDTGFCTLRWDTTMAYQTNTSCDSSTAIPYYSNPSVQFDPPGVCGPAPIGDGTANVAGLINFSRNSVSQYRIGSTQVWARPNLISFGLGTNFSPFSRVWMAVQDVRGGTTEGVVKVFSGTYEESVGGAAPRVLNGACVMQSADGGSAVLR